MQDDGVDGDGSRDLDFTTTLPDSLDLDPAQVDAVPRGRALPFGSAAEPEMLGRYVVVDTLGRGGMGVVLRAFDRELDRPVALKVLHDDIEERDTTRLRREAQALVGGNGGHVVEERMRAMLALAGNHLDAGRYEEARRLLTSLEKNISVVPDLSELFRTLQRRAEAVTTTQTLPTTRAPPTSSAAPSTSSRSSQPNSTPNTGMR